MKKVLLELDSFYYLEVTEVFWIRFWGLLWHFTYESYDSGRKPNKRPGSLVLKLLCFASYALVISGMRLTWPFPCKGAVTLQRMIECMSSV